MTNIIFVAIQDDDQSISSSSSSPEHHASSSSSSIELNLSSTVTSARAIPTAYQVPRMRSLLKRAVEVIDILGKNLPNLNPSIGFISGMASRGNKISILAFEVANTIVKGANLFQSLSVENIQFLNEGVLHSDGVQRLVSTNMKELRNIATADKWDEFDVFCKEVGRFGDMCEDPQWHNLYRKSHRFCKCTNKVLKEQTEMTFQELTSLARLTTELYHELHALDRLLQDYCRKLVEVDSTHLPGESLMILHSKVKFQSKLVRVVKKKSLWCKSLEEVVEKLCDVATFIRHEIMEAYGNDRSEEVLPTQVSKTKIEKRQGKKQWILSMDMNNGTTSSDTNQSAQRLGVCGLALHYANIINQIDNIVSQSTSLPPNMRDTLYQGLPSAVKAALRSRLQSFNSKKELTVPQIKAEMEKTLRWLVPVAANTIKAHFGWVGEWTNTGNESMKKTSGQKNPIRLQTLYHAVREETELYILDLVVWLHYLIRQERQCDIGFKPMGPVWSPIHKVLVCPSEPQAETSPARKSQGFFTVKRRETRSLGFSSGSTLSRTFNATQDIEEINISLLDIVDGLHTPISDLF
ncbi:hypothetical protein AQUCO_00200567v1 [Aquilegia coerulea]|uniref:DUF668 domain-containing protein n=1 Tax=Aquilegia coerulea TaxID=218851 RepID=A0A2G5F3T9_AQUCA|nr:hypothetical protein AQUCO_00200567v1 [Aquilegia coerulea]